MSQDAIAPLVSVIIPTFNRAQFLGRTLESALAQTHSHLEVLVMDDGSADDTPNVVARYQEQDARIRYVRHPENLGLVRNWKAGIAAATGSFFCILGDDDSLEPTFVEELLAPLQADPNLVLSFCDHWIMDHAGTRLLERSRENTSYWRRDQLRRGALTDFFRIALIDRAIFIGATLFRRDFVDPGFLEDEASAFVDVWMLYHCGQQGEGYYVPARLCTCRWQPGGVSRSWKWRMYGFPGEIHCYRHFLHDPALQKYADIFRV
ncbi:MAG: glycosyltransferase family 2 protein, partial [Bacteroidota bacterium]